MVIADTPAKHEKGVWITILAAITKSEAPQQQLPSTLSHRGKRGACEIEDIRRRPCTWQQHRQRHAITITQILNPSPRASVCNLRDERIAAYNFAPSLSLGTSTLSGGGDVCAPRGCVSRSHTDPILSLQTPTAQAAHAHTLMPHSSQ